VGPHGFVLATDIADRMLAYLDEAARNEGLTNVQTRVMMPACSLWSPNLSTPPFAGWR
jgi:hypothetical protein